MVRKKMNIYLDLDETLVHSIDIRYRKFISIEIEKFKNYNFENIYIILERPGLQKFLDWLFEHFTVSIWSAASSDYVNFIKKNIIESPTRKIERTLHSKHCDKSQYYYGDDHIKKLNMLWEILNLPDHDITNTILLDDLCMNLRSQPKNCIRIKKFLGSPDDNELEKVKKKLKDVLTNFKQKKDLKSPIRKKVQKNIRVDMMAQKTESDGGKQVSMKEHQSGTMIRSYQSAKVDKKQTAVI